MIKIRNDSQKIQTGSLNSYSNFDIYDSENRTLSIQANDELYVIIRTICVSTQSFYKPFLPESPEYDQVLQDLNEDLMKLCQQLIF